MNTLTSGADFYARRDLPDTTDREPWRAIVMELSSLVEAQGATWVRLTCLNEDQPDPEGKLPYGIYIEGWKVRPDVQPPFGYPVELV